MIRNFLHHWWLRNRYDWRGKWLHMISWVLVPLITVVLCEFLVFSIFDIRYLGGYRVDQWDQPIYYFSNMDKSVNFDWIPGFFMLLALLPGGYMAMFVENFFEHLHIPNKRWP